MGEQAGITMTVTSQPNKITGISPTSISSATATSVQLTGTVGSGDLVIWATNCSAATPNVDPNDGTDQSTSYTVTGVGTYKLCLRENGASDSVEKAGITMTVTSQPNKITGVTPSTISDNTATDVTLTGTVGTGDLVIWATDCSAATPNVDPTDGTDQSTSMTVTPAGTYKLCLRENGASDSVEQTGVSLTVS